jgi:hypothetical protein
VSPAGVKLFDHFRIAVIKVRNNRFTEHKRYLAFILFHLRGQLSNFVHSFPGGIVIDHAADIPPENGLAMDISYDYREIGFFDDFLKNHLYFSAGTVLAGGQLPEPDIRGHHALGVGLQLTDDIKGVPYKDNRDKDYPDQQEKFENRNFPDCKSYVI